MIAIHNSTKGFHPRWIDYCKRQGIPHKIVNCYANDLMEQLKDCRALMWHFSHSHPKDILIARQILFALEHTGFGVFPDFRTAWHFDDKVAQKYLLERVNAPLVPSYVFFDAAEAMQWLRSTSFPKVFKLRGGAGSSNVRLVRDRSLAERLVKQAFGKGFSNYDPAASFKDRWYHYRSGRAGIMEPVKGLLRFLKPPAYAKAKGRERNYVYFQDFIPENDSDTRIIVIAGKAFALKRYVRPNDFRASGSGVFAYGRVEFDERCIAQAFELTERLKAQCLAFDFVFNERREPLVVEISYGYTATGYDPCPGYWDRQLNWHEGRFDHESWMVDLILESTNGGSGKI
jgi:glutathione synthase/RimK-type ligase-like ATP-grasp enzyme